MPPKPVMLVILDGFGWRQDQTDNAVRLAKAPNFQALWTEFPHAFLQASGHNVGLPDGQMGNSEVGHLTIGAGRVIKQELARIGDSVADGSIARLPAFVNLVAALKQSGGTCHLMGLVSPGGVHSHQDHAAGVAGHLSKAGIKTVVHAFTDGRDTPPQSAIEDLARLTDALPNDVKVVTVVGRYFAMDRDKRWDRVSQAYATLTEGKGARFETPAEAIQAGYDGGKHDEFIPASVIGDYAGMKDGDAVLCFNFRADRVREILAALLDPGFDGFQRGRVIKFSAAVGMTRYSDALAPFMTWLFDAEHLNNILGQVVANAGKTQLRMAETEKFAHVTYFLNGGQETPFKGEDRVLVASPKVATYDMQPEMSAPELTDRAVEAIDSGKYDMIVLNYANPDMVGHTGDLAAAIKAVETVDAGLGRIVAAMKQQGGALIVSADHGNCEMMKDPDNRWPAHVAHDQSGAGRGDERVPLESMKDGSLADLAPTMLDLMGIPIPREMTGHSILHADAARAAE